MKTLAIETLEISHILGVEIYMRNTPPHQPSALARNLLRARLHGIEIMEIDIAENHVAWGIFIEAHQGDKRVQMNPPQIVFIVNNSEGKRVMVNIGGYEQLVAFFKNRQ